MWLPSPFVAAISRGHSSSTEKNASQDLQAHQTVEHSASKDEQVIFPEAGPSTEHDRKSASSAHKPPCGSMLELLHVVHASEPLRCSASLQTSIRARKGSWSSLRNPSWAERSRRKQQGIGSGEGSTC